MNKVTKRIIQKTGLFIMLVFAFAYVVNGKNSAYAKPEPIKQVVVQHDEYLVKRKAMYMVLKAHNSPLAAHVDELVTAATENNIDPYLLPAIAGIESYFGQQLLEGTHNPFGWGGGTIYFKSWGEGFSTVAAGLRQNYINKGATTIEQIARIYCPPNSIVWSGKVRYFMSKFEAAEKDIVSPVRL